MTPITLVYGGTAAAREAAIAAALAATAPGASAAALLEGLADGRPALAERPGLRVIRIAPGCPCCVGNLTLRVTLNRLLRQAPAQLFLGLAGTGHLPQIRAFLCQPPYHELLRLNSEIRLDSNQ